MLTPLHAADASWIQHTKPEILSFGDDGNHTEPAVAANGAVVIAIQRSTNRAEITSNRVTTSGPNDRIDILAKMDGNARVDVITGTLGAAAVGAAVAVSYINTTNYAYAEVDQGELRSSVINVVAGGASEQYYKTGAVTTAITVGAGAFAAALG